MYHVFCVDTLHERIFQVMIHVLTCLYTAWTLSYFLDDVSCLFYVDTLHGRLFFFLSDELRVLL